MDRAGAVTLSVSGSSVKQKTAGSRPARVCVVISPCLLSSVEKNLIDEGGCPDFYDYKSVGGCTRLRERAVLRPPQSMPFLLTSLPVLTLDLMVFAL